MVWCKVLLLKCTYPWYMIPCRDPPHVLRCKWCLGVISCSYLHCKSVLLGSLDFICIQKHHIWHSCNISASHLSFLWDLENIKMGQLIYSSPCEKSKKRSLLKSVSKKEFHPPVHWVKNFWKRLNENIPFHFSRQHFLIFLDQTC